MTNNHKKLIAALHKVISMKIYYHGRSGSRPYKGRYIYITDSLEYASSYTKGIAEVYKYSIPFSLEKIFSIKNPKHRLLLQQCIDKRSMDAILKDSGGDEMDWTSLQYISTDDFEDAEELFMHLGFFGIKLRERPGIESIYIFDESKLKHEGKCASKYWKERPF